MHPGTLSSPEWHSFLGKALRCSAMVRLFGLEHLRGSIDQRLRLLFLPIFVRT